MASASQPSCTSRLPLKGSNPVPTQSCPQPLEENSFKDASEFPVIRFKASGLVIIPDYFSSTRQEAYGILPILISNHLCRTLLNMHFLLFLRNTSSYSTQNITRPSSKLWPLGQVQNREFWNPNNLSSKVSKHKRPTLQLSRPMAKILVWENCLQKMPGELRNMPFMC